MENKNHVVSCGDLSLKLSTSGGPPLSSSPVSNYPGRNPWPLFSSQVVEVLDKQGEETTVVRRQTGVGADDDAALHR